MHPIFPVCPPRTARTIVTRCVLGCLLLLVCTALSQPAAATQGTGVLSADAAPAEADNKAPQENSNTDQPTNDPAPVKVIRDKKKGDIFIPSEEISEDFAVSFPVDI